MPTAELLFVSLLVLRGAWGFGMAPEDATQAPPGPARFRIQVFHLFAETGAQTPIAFIATEVPTRAFHQPGDPDSLFTFGKPTPEGELRLKAAFEVNDVVLHAIAPDLRVDPTDTRPRAAGDYRALDARGRPYQLRLGARLVW